jgi:lipopolysaccharide export system protein LptA
MSSILPRFVLVSVLLSSVLCGQAPLQRTQLTADDLVMTSTDTETRTVCTGNVLLTGTNMKIACDRLEVIVARSGESAATIGKLEGFKYLLATGNVRLVQGDREATCGRAEVLPLEDKVVLSESPILLDRSSDSMIKGSKITLLQGERRVLVENPEVSGPPIKDLGPDPATAQADPIPSTE